MATILEQNRATFYRLPKELHLEIFECLKNLALSPKSNCRALRLVHPSFAHLDDIKTFLFRTVVVKPSKERLGDISGLSTIAQYVHHIDIEPVRMGSRSTMVQLVSLLRLLPGVRVLTLRDCAQPVPGTQESILPEALVLADLTSQCLTAADVRLQGLSICYQSEFFVDMNEVVSWKDLDLSEVTSLHFHPRIGYYRTSHRARQHYRHKTSEEITEAFISLLSRCTGRLEELSYRDTTSLLLCFHETVPMPAIPTLRRLTLHAMEMHQPRFTFWLNNCISLEEISLSEINLFHSDRSLSYWRPLFSALGHHPNRLNITMEKFPVDARNGSFFSLHHHTSAPAQETAHLHKQQSCVAGANICFIIKNYISGIGEWVTEEDQAILTGRRLHISDVPSTCCEATGKR